MGWRVVTDFDGTVTIDDLTNAILDRFANPSWRSIEAEWETGQIGSRECMARQISLMRAGVEELDAFVATTAVDPYFAPFVAACGRRGIPVTVASDGLDRVIGSVLRRIGLAALPVLANHLVFVGEGRWRLSFPHGRSDCRVRSGTCKCAAAGPTSADGLTTVLIGDGRSDLCAAGIADYVLAKNELAALCQERRIAYETFETFEDAGRLLADLVDGGSRMQAPAGTEETTYA